MSIGSKIKQERLKRSMTQKSLADGIVTRNMLSAIETDKALPSIDTLKALCKRLDTPIGFIISEDENKFFYEKDSLIVKIKSLLRAKSYRALTELVEGMSDTDDELSLILAECYFHLSREALRQGSLNSSLKYAELCERHCEQTVYDTQRYTCSLPLYKAIARNVSSPLLEFDMASYEKAFLDTTEHEFYHYLIQDATYSYSDEFYKTHLDAKRLIKERRYSEALELLLALIEIKKKGDSNAYLTFCLYSDLEICYKQLFDFEKAYKYSSKRISLMEGFQS